MPRYDFTCTECGTKFEKNVPFSDNLIDATCPRGHQAVRRIYSSPQVVFKGNGWYITDHRRASTGATSGVSSSE